MHRLNTAVSLLVQILLTLCLFWLLTSGAFLIDREFYNFLSGNLSLHLLSLRTCALLILSIAFILNFNYPELFKTWEPFRTIFTFYRLSPKLSLTVLFLAYGLTQSLTLIFMHAGLGTALWDTGFNDQIIWNTAHGNFLINSVRGGQNILGEHFFLFQAVLSVVYHFTDRLEALFIIQSFSIAACIPFIYLITKKITDSHAWGLTLATALFFYAPLRNGILFPFHTETFADPFLLLGFFFSLNKKWFFAFISLFLAMSCKENISMEVFGIGLFLAISQRRKAGWGICALSLVTLFAVMRIIEPYFSFGYSWNKWGYYSHFTHPTAERWAAVFQSLFSLSTIKFLGLILAPVLFLPLASFSWFWLMGPTLGIRLLTNFPGFKIITAHYTVGLNAVLFIAAVYGVYALFKKPSFNSKFAQISVLGASLFFTGVPGLFTLENQIWEASFAQNQRIVKILQSIPSEYSVVASENYLPHVAHRAHVFSFANVEPGAPLEEIERNAEIAIIDRTRNAKNDQMALEKRIDRGYSLIFTAPGIEIYNNSITLPQKLEPLIHQWRGFTSEKTVNYRKIVRSYYKPILIISFCLFIALLIRRTYTATAHAASR